MSSQYNVINGSLLGLHVISFVLLIVGVFTPGWNIYYSEYTGMRTYTGIWYIRFCPDGAPCWTDAIPEVDDDMDTKGLMKHTMMQYQVCSTLAIASSIAGSILLVLVMTSRVAKSTETEVTRCFVFCIISWLALISGLLTVHMSGAFGSQTKKLYDQYKIEDSAKLYFPYSVLLIFLGGVASLVTWLVIALTRPWRFTPGTNGNVVACMNEQEKKHELNGF